MVDAMQWMSRLIVADFATILGGLLVLILLIELLTRLREWIS